MPTLKDSAMKEVEFLKPTFASPRSYAIGDRETFDDERADQFTESGRARLIAVVDPPAAVPKPASNDRKIRVKVRLPNRPLAANGLPSTRKIGNQILRGGEEDELEPSEAMELLVAGDVELCEGEQLTVQDLAFARAIQNHPQDQFFSGKPRPRYEDFA
jgi:hypothetical protein